MALPRRTLPSRMPSAAGAEKPSPSPAPAVEKADVPAAEPASQSVATPAIPAVPVADNPFSTLPSSSRVLEESFQPVTPAVPAEISAPVAEAAPVPEPVAAPVQAAVEVAQPAAPVSDLPSGFALEETAAPDPAPVPVAAPMPEPASSPVMAEPAPVAVEPVAAAVEVPVAAPAPAPEPESAPVAVSLPDANPVRRRVREKKPRDFSAVAATAPEIEPERAEPQVESKIPVSNQPLNRVDEKLISTGIIAPPPADSLTSSVPSGLSESSAPWSPSPLPDETPAQSAAPVTAAAELPPVAPLPPAPVVPDIAAAAPADAAPAAASSFDLSKTQATPAKASEPLPPPASDLPWANTSGGSAEWEVELPESPSWSHESVQENTPGAPAELPPPADLYRPREAPAAGGVPPWQGATPRAGAALPPPELPRALPRKSSGAAMSLALVAVGVLAAVGGGVYLLRPGSSQQGKFQEQMARLTGTLQDQTEALPGVSGTAATGPLLKPESTFNMAQFGPGVLLPPSASMPAPVAPVVDTAISANSSAPVSGSAVVEFADVPPGQAGQPITADGSEKMPDDISFMARLQKEIKNARADKEGREAEAKVSETVAAAKDDTPYTPEKLNAELDAYRRALAQSPNPGTLKPNEFMRDPDGYMDGKTMGQQQADAGAGTSVSGTLLPPPAAQQQAMLPPPELYTNNPKGLPIVAEPSAAAPQRVRTLADFGVEAFEPERPKVEIPKGLKPKLAATDFPSLEILSFVPGRGVVAYADGREGVLLLGESINGWELTMVAPDHAEFRAGRKTYQVTADN